MQGAIYILIMVLGGASSQSGLTSINQEFTSLERCEAARNSIILQSKESHTSKIQSSGCFKK